MADDVRPDDPWARPPSGDPGAAPTAAPVPAAPVGPTATPMRPVGPDDGDPDRRGRFGRFGLGLAGLLLLALVIVGVIVGGVIAVVVAFSGDDSTTTGTKSLRLPVTVTPRDDLQPDQEVRVRSTAFEANTIVGIAQCLPAADRDSAGIGACDVEGGAGYAVGPDGTLDVPFAVRRIITVDDEAHDCATVEGGCLVVAADANDRNRSGGQAISFAEGLPPAVPQPVEGRAPTLLLPITADASPPIPAGQEVTLEASGFVPGEPMLLAWCTAEVEQRGPVDTCEPEDTTAAGNSLLGNRVDGIDRRAGEGGTYSATLPARAVVRPTLGDGEQRCTEAEPCAFVVAAAADPQRSAILRYWIED